MLPTSYPQPLTNGVTRTDSKGLEAARELVNLAEHGIEIRVKGEMGTGILSAHIDVTSHRGDQGHVGIDLGSAIRQTAVELFTAWED